MKTKALVLTFAVCAVCTGSLVAQQTPSQELAPIVAVEEQERDLAKAERLYKEAIDGGKLSAAGELALREMPKLLRGLREQRELAVSLAGLLSALSVNDRRALRGVEHRVFEAGQKLHAAAMGVVDAILGEVADEP